MFPWSCRGRHPLNGLRAALSPTGAAAAAWAARREQDQHIEFDCRARRAARPPRPHRWATRPPAARSRMRPRQDQGNIGGHLQDSRAAGRRSVVVIVLSTFKMAMTLLDGSSIPALLHGRVRASSAFGSAPRGGWRQAGSARAGDASRPRRRPIGRQSFNSSAPNASDSTASVEIPQATADTLRLAGHRSDYHRHDSASWLGRPVANSRRTGPADGKIAGRPIGGPALRAAALKGRSIGGL